MDIIVGSIGHSGDEYQNQINTEGHDIKEQMLYAVKMRISRAGSAFLTP